MTQVSKSLDGAPSQQHSNSDGSADRVALHNATAEQPSTFLLDCLSQALHSPQALTHLLLFLPSQQGHLVRSDILEIRLTGCPLLNSYVNLAEPTEPFHEPITDSISSMSLHDILEKCIGACIVTSKAAEAWTSLLAELSLRLCAPMLLKGIRQRRNLAILECGKSPASGLGLFRAAKALNIGIVALDKPGHWISRDDYASWREAFIPIDRTLDEGLTDRIVAAMQGHHQHVDAIVSFFDPLLAPTAAAAERLNLPTAPVEAYRIATDKQRTSEFDGRPAYRVSSLESALETVHQQVASSSSASSGALSYPLIVKPCAGWGSEGVFRAANETELVRAVKSIDFDRHGSEFVLENYCSGPEVDANFVLCDGELLFFEISDDIPKDADFSTTQVVADNSRAPQTFIEVANVLPSALPRAEQRLLKDSLHQTLLRLGFSSGFFHLEARVNNSRVEYAKDKTGILDLKQKDEADPSVGDSSPSVWLIEINARPPGLQASWASRDTYGVDFWGVALSSALNDKESVRALAIPFDTKTGSQYWCQIVFVPVTRGGVFQSDDVCQDLMQRRPDLAKHISRSMCFFERGLNIPEPSEGLLTWVAYYLVFSRESRQEVMRIAEAVRKETTFTIT